jgi:arylsulfatase A-like enzyme
MGDHRLLPGKRTAFDTDIRVPLVVAGPGIRPGSRTSAIAQNIDLGPTFADIAGTRMPGADGASLLPFLRGHRPRPWRTAAIIEHQNAPPYPGDPDFQPFTAGDPPTYEALRLAHATYVEEHAGDRELYDRSVDPSEIVDLYETLTLADKRLLAARIARLRRCHGWSHCRGT